jgi:hypothetical protein
MLEKFKEFQIESSHKVIGGSSSINERPATIPVFQATGGQRFEDHRTNINWNTSSSYVGVNPANGREMYRS